MKKQKIVTQLCAKELDDALERIDILRGDKEESSAAIDLAFLRMDELTELKRENKKLEENNNVDHTRLRDK